MFWLSHRQYRTRCPSDNGFRNAAHEKLLQSGPSMRRHHDDVHIFILRHLHDRIRRMSTDKLLFIRNIFVVGDNSIQLLNFTLKRWIDGTGKPTGCREGSRRLNHMDDD